MKILWTKSAEKNLGKIIKHTKDNFSDQLAARTYFEIKLAVLKLSEFPKLGRRIGGHQEKRQLVISGNTIVYEIVLASSPYIVIRNIKPRRTNIT